MQINLGLQKSLKIHKLFYFGSFVKIVHSHYRYLTVWIRINTMGGLLIQNPPEDEWGFRILNPHHCKKADGLSTLKAFSNIITDQIYLSFLVQTKQYRTGSKQA